MGVLDVVDGVLARLLLGQLDVEVDPRRRPARGEEPARRVDADLVEELVEGDERAGPLAHRDLDAVDDEADPGDQQHPDRFLVVAHRLGGVADPGDGAVVVGAPDVDQLLEAAAELLGDVADVRGEVGRLAVRAQDHPVLVVAERRRAEPGRAVLLVDVAAGPQPLDRPADPALGVERALALPDVEVDAEVGEAGLDPGPDRAGRPRPDDLGRVGTGRLRGGQDRLRQRVGERLGVVAVIAVLGDRRPGPQGEDRRPELADLGARIVEVVLARDGMAAGLEDPAQDVADECAAGVADRQRPGRVGRHELDVDPPRRGRRDPAPARGLGQDPAHDAVERGVGQAQVDEARRGDVDRGERRRGRDRRRPRGSAPRRSPGRSRAAPGAAAGPASSRGSWPGRRARGSPAAETSTRHRARPRLGQAARPTAAASARSIAAIAARAQGGLGRLLGDHARNGSRGRRVELEVEPIARVDEGRGDAAAGARRRRLGRRTITAGEQVGQQDPADAGLRWPGVPTSPASRWKAPAGTGPRPERDLGQEHVARAGSAAAGLPPGRSRRSRPARRRRSPSRADPEAIRVVGVDAPCGPRAGAHRSPGPGHRRAARRRALRP